FGHQREADHEQEAQTQDHDGGVGVHEARERLGGEQHHPDGDDHGGHHHFEVVDHAHRGNHRIEREHGVEHHDLGDDDAKTGVGGRLQRSVTLSFNAFVHFHGALEDQEKSAEYQDEVAPREPTASDMEERRGQVEHPCYGREQRQAHDQRQREPHDARPVALLGGQLVCQNGNEDQIVDPENDLEDHQSQQADPYAWVEQ